MSIDLTKLRITGTIFSLLAFAFLYYGLQSKLAYVSGCRARLANLELITTRSTQNEAALDAKEKALDAAEAQLDSIKQ